jgi:TetR/AcrR family transcriptional repressor of nem operon
MGRPSDARAKVLRAARQLIARRGYAGLGVAEICAAAGVPKGSFYYFFDSKQALALAVIEEHWTIQRAQWAALLGSDRPPLERLRQLFEATAAVQQEAQKDSGVVTGCLFGNLTLELSTQDEAVRTRLQEIFEDQIDMVAAVVETARHDGAVQVADTREAARAVVAQLEGMVLFAKLLNDPAQLDQMWSHSLALLGVPAATAQREGVGVS